MTQKIGLMVLVIVLLLSPNAGSAQMPLPVAPSQNTAGRSVAMIAPEVQQTLANLPDGSMTTVIATLKAQEDLSKITGTNHAERQRKVIKALQARADTTQGPIRALLSSRQAQGQVGQVTYLWVFNGFSVTATADVIQELAARSELFSITPDDIQITPVGVAGTPAGPNLAAIKAPALWDLGFQGQGIVVANTDSGVDMTHPDLANRWRGGTNSWFDPYGEHPTVPTDRSGHGTWTMGVMVGGGGSGTVLGTAPQARWIAAKIFNDRGTATATAIHRAFQWLLDPDGNPATADAPAVVNNSWAFGSPGCNLAFQLDVQALRAAGILPVFAGGNFGPGAGSSVSPANYPEAFAVGAVDNTGQIYPSSSRGLSACGQAGAVYPSLVAPGVQITTTDLFGGYYTATGTSLAAPHVAGALALLLSAYPTLSAAQQEVALRNSATDLGPAGPDNDFGYGQLDVLAAYRQLLPVYGPVIGQAGLTPSLTNGTESVVLTATVSSALSAITAAEYFSDTLGDAGKGVAMSAADGSYGSPTEAVSITLSTADLAMLASDGHTFYVHGRDALGNWGPAGSAVLHLDRTGPVIEGITLTLGTINSTGTLTALTTDPANGASAGSNIVAAEWSDGIAPSGGSGAPLVAADGAFDNPTEAVTATVDIGGWASGAPHTLWVQARDMAGNWGPVLSRTVARFDFPLVPGG